MDFDETRLYFSHQQLQQQSAGPGDDDDHADAVNQNQAAGLNVNEDDARVDLQAVRRHFREFLRKCFDRQFAVYTIVYCIHCCSLCALCE
jgi:hypothetical protein